MFGGAGRRFDGGYSSLGAGGAAEAKIRNTTVSGVVASSVKVLWDVVSPTSELVFLISLPG